MTGRKAGKDKPFPVLLWLKAVRDHPNRPPPLQCHALTCLALRMDWKTGKGYASGTQLAEDAGCHRHTAERATAWAREQEPRLAVRTKRGHALRNGTAIASEWRLCLPQPDLESTTDSGFQIWKVPAASLEGTNSGLEGTTRSPPSIPTPSEPVSSSPAAARPPAPQAGGRAAAPGAPVRDGSVEDMGTCPRCGRITEVTDGRAPPHNGKDGQPCPGSGEPADTTEPPYGWGDALSTQAETDEARAWLDARTGEDR